MGPFARKRVPTRIAFAVSSASRSSRHRAREIRDDPVEREQVAISTEPRDARDARACDPRHVTIGLAGLGVRHVHLDARHGHRLEGVVERDRRVRVRARVEENRVEPLARFGDPVAERPLVVRLAAVDRRAELARAGAQTLVKVGERLFAVDVGLARPQKLEVRAREAKDPGRLASSRGTSDAQSRRHGLELGEELGRGGPH